MSNIKSKLITQALNKYKHILPCGFNKTIEEGFRKYDQYLCFWFNSKDGNTHLMKIKI